MQLPTPEFELQKTEYDEWHKHTMCSGRKQDFLDLKSKLDKIINVMFNPLPYKKNKARDSLNSKRGFAHLAAATNALELRSPGAPAHAYAPESHHPTVTARNYRKHKRQQDKTRKQNIIIHGLGTALQDTTNAHLKDVVENFLRENLHVSIKPRSVHLLGLETWKPIRVKLDTMRDKRTIFRNCHRLKPFGRLFRVTSDLTVQERIALRPLQEDLNETKARGGSAFIRNQTLYANGVPTLLAHLPDGLLD